MSSLLPFSNFLEFGIISIGSRSSRDSKCHRIEGLVGQEGGVARFFLDKSCWMVAKAEWFLVEEEVIHV